MAQRCVAVGSREAGVGDMSGKKWQELDAEERVAAMLWFLEGAVAGKAARELARLRKKVLSAVAEKELDLEAWALEPQFPEGELRTWLATKGCASFGSPLWAGRN